MGSSSYLWDMKWSNMFQEPNADRIFLVTIWEWWEFQGFACLPVRSGFRLRGTFLSEFDNTFCLNAGRFDVNWMHWLVWHLVSTWVTILENPYQILRTNRWEFRGQYNFRIHHKVLNPWGDLFFTWLKYKRL